jgi:hypothetical protein
MSAMAEVVQCELIFQAEHAVLVVLHVLDERGTPLKRFSTPARGAAASDSLVQSAGASAVSSSTCSTPEAFSASEEAAEVRQATSGQHAEEGEVQQQQQRKLKSYGSDTISASPGLLRRLAHLLEQLVAKEQGAAEQVCTPGPNTPPLRTLCAQTYVLLP